MNFITRTACLHASVKNERVRESERDNASDNSGVYNISQPDRRIRRNAITSCDGVRDGGNVRRATRTVECLRKDSSDSVVGERYRHTIPPGATRIFRLFRSGSPCPSYPLVPPSVLTSRTLPRPRSRPISTASVLLLLLPPPLTRKPDTNRRKITNTHVRTTFVYGLQANRAPGPTINRGSVSQYFSYVLAPF